PSQINTAGLTHLNFAFASIDPKTFKIKLQNQDDEDVYRQFLAIKKGSLQLWLGIGGWEFSDPGETQTTWSDLAASPDNRKTFISSTSEFLKHYGFQGLDIDWEWPAASNHGGRPDDTKNQVTLLKELREALGTTYGLSCVLPLDGSYLRGIDISGIASQVDWLNVLTYDLHGAWGAQIRPHTDVKEIDEKLNALWESGVNPRKFTFGLSYYGRGYTLSDRNCQHVGCSFSAPSQQGKCSKQTGILSNTEIKRIIREKNLRPEMIEDGSGSMQVAWDDQWIGYDSPRTIGKKKELANDRCMGGTAIWAIDYDSS
ncbi:glycoside hydrolase family 18 protein, partial [Periconia macrospinosa]